MKKLSILLGVTTVVALAAATLPLFLVLRPGMLPLTWRGAIVGACLAVLAGIGYVLGQVRAPHGFQRFLDGKGAAPTPQEMFSTEEAKAWLQRVLQSPRNPSGETPARPSSTDGLPVQQKSPYDTPHA